VQEPTILYEDGSLLFEKDLKVFKLWYTCGWLYGNVCYAESKDGINFVRYNQGTPVLYGTGRSFIFHHDKYYMFTTAERYGQDWDRYESTDGVTWTLTAENTLPIGESNWEKLATGNIFVWIENSTWYAMYEAYGADKAWRMGLATSPDGVHWTKNANNPVVSIPYCGGPEIHKIAGTYYMWTQCSSKTNDPSSDIYKMHSTDLVNWTLDLIELGRQTPDEGAPRFRYGSQVADPTMVEVNGVVYLYYDATRTQEPDAKNAIHLNLAIANMSLATLAAEPGVP
jgi:sucrose-6-phosphate hydrolase SacC (GH32 family)